MGFGRKLALDDIMEMGPSSWNLPLYEKTRNTCVGEDVEQLEISSIGGGSEDGVTTSENCFDSFFFIKLHTYLSYDPAILLLPIYPPKIKTYIHTRPGLG